MQKKCVFFILIFLGMSSYAQETFKVATRNKGKVNSLSFFLNDGEYLQVNKKHQNVTFLAFSDYGKYLVSGCNDFSVRLWDLNNQKTTTSNPGNNFTQRNFFSPDGNYVVFNNEDYNIKLIRTLTGVEIGTFPGKSEIEAIAFSPDGHLMATGNRDNTINLWNIESGALVSTLYGHLGWVSALTFSPDGAHIASAGNYDKSIRVFDVNSAQQIKCFFEVANSSVGNLRYSSDGKYLIARSSNNVVFQVDAASGQRLKTFSTDASSFAVNGKFMACGGIDGMVDIWDLETGTEFKSFRNTRAKILSIAFSKDNKYLALSAENEGAIMLFDFSKLEEGKTFVKSPPLLSIKENSVVFTDAKGNNQLDAGETATVGFVLVNTGEGAAKGLKVVSNLGGSTKDILVLAPTLTELGMNKEVKVQIILKAGLELQNGKVLLNLKVAEPNGLDSPPVDVEFNTVAIQPPKVVVADGVFSSEQKGSLKQNFPAKFEMLIQNIGTGDAEDVTVDIKLPNNVLSLDRAFHPIEKLVPGESVRMNTNFIVTARYSQSEVPIKITLHERHGRYGSEKIFTAHMDQVLNVAHLNVEGGGILHETAAPASLHSGVDRDIPVNSATSNKRYALVIGNEDYQQFQTGLKNDQNVAFARNDAMIFKEYLVKTLGFPEKQVFLITDATRGQMGRQLERLTELAKLDPGAELVLYYAGHGLPDQETREGYLMPVDVTASDIKEGISLKDLYGKLASTDASKVIVFLDACFSGGGRGENGLLAARSVRIKPKGEIIEGNIIAFTAASGEEVSLPYEKESHGLFTYFLLQKIKETKGKISMEELMTYLETEMPKASLLENSMKQTPQLLTAPNLGDAWLQWNF
jgi:WD40 repeat protein